MEFFAIIGMLVSGIVALGLLFLLVMLVIDFIGYQKGARNMRD